MKRKQDSIAFRVYTHISNSRGVSSKQAYTYITIEKEKRGLALGSDATEKRRSRKFFSNGGENVV
jgi:hypothetical protein